MNITKQNSMREELLDIKKELEKLKRGQAEVKRIKKEKEILFNLLMMTLATFLFLLVFVVFNL